jgi:hypothetical protein
VAGADVAEFATAVAGRAGMGADAGRAGMGAVGLSGATPSEIAVFLVSAMVIEFLSFSSENLAFYTADTRIPNFYNFYAWYRFSFMIPYI